MKYTNSTNILIIIVILALSQNTISRILIDGNPKNKIRLQNTETEVIEDPTINLQDTNEHKSTLITDEDEDDSPIIHNKTIDDHALSSATLSFGNDEEQNLKNVQEKMDKSAEDILDLAELKNGLHDPTEKSLSTPSESTESISKDPEEVSDDDQLNPQIVEDRAKMSLLDMEQAPKLDYEQDSKTLDYNLKMGVNNQVNEVYDIKQNLKTKVKNSEEVIEAEKIHGNEDEHTEKVKKKNLITAVDYNVIEDQTKEKDASADPLISPIDLDEQSYDLENDSQLKAQVAEYSEISNIADIVEEENLIEKGEEGLLQKIPEPETQEDFLKLNEIPKDTDTKWTKQLEEQDPDRLIDENSNKSVDNNNNEDGHPVEPIVDNHVEQLDEEHPVVLNENNEPVVETEHVEEVVENEHVEEVVDQNKEEINPYSKEALEKKEAVVDNENPNEEHYESVKVIRSLIYSIIIFIMIR